MPTFNVILESIDNPGKFTFITVEDADDLEDCINSIPTNQFTIDQITEVN
jgi:hypothetical protein